MMNDQNPKQPSQNQSVPQQPAQRLTQAREVRMNPKVVVWIAIVAGAVALWGFSNIFLYAGIRKEWWW